MGSRTNIGCRLSQYYTSVALEDVLSLQIKGIVTVISALILLISGLTFLYFPHYIIPPPAATTAAAAINVSAANHNNISNFGLSLLAEAAAGSNSNEFWIYRFMIPSGFLVFILIFYFCLISAVFVRHG